MGEAVKYQNGHSIPADILDELAARFIINIPPEEKDDMVRVCFQIELAHWFFTDFYVTGEPSLKLSSGNMREFAEHIFRHVPFLQPHANKVEEIVDTWREYKLAVPTYGAIILNPALDKVLLVQGFSAKASWGFPKGKVNEEESPDLCAAREVMEEIGYDIAPKLDAEEYLEQVINDKLVRLYVIAKVEETTKFQTNTRCEIRDIKWFPIDSLPTCKTDQSSKAKLGVAANSFFMVIPFLRDIKSWVKLASRDGMASQAPSTPAGQKKKKKSRGDEEGDGRLRGTPIEQPPLGKESTDRARVAAQAVARVVPGREAREVRSSVPRDSAPREIAARGSVTKDSNIQRPVARRADRKSQEKEKPKAKRVEETAKSRKTLFKAPEGEVQSLGTHPEPQGALVQGHEGLGGQQQLPGVLQLNQGVLQQMPVGPKQGAGAPVKGLGLLPAGFLPRAWSQFRLNEEELVAAALGGSSDGVMHRGRVH